MKTLTPQNAEYYHQDPYYEVPTLTSLTAGQEIARVVIGSDLVLSVSMERRRDVLVLAFDGDGNCLTEEGLGRFASRQEAMAALPSVIAVAERLFPNHLRMAVNATEAFKA